MFKEQKKGISLVEVDHYPVDDVTKLFIAYEMACAIEAFHSIGVKNLDLRPENILLDNVNNHITCNIRLQPSQGLNWEQYRRLVKEFHLLPDELPELSPDAQMIIPFFQEILAPFRNHILTLFLDSMIKIPVGTVIYRGQTDAFAISQDGKKAHVNRRMLDSDRHTYFGLRHLETTVNYGITARFSVNQPLELINITERSTYDRLKEKMFAEDQEKAVEALEKAFPLNEDGQVIRHSQKRYDFAVLDFICRYTGYEGYIQPRIKTVDGGHMHPEMAVCSHKTGKINDPFGQQAAQPPQGETYASLYSEYRMRLVEQQRRAARQQSRKRRAEPVNTFSPLLTKRLLFD